VRYITAGAYIKESSNPQERKKDFLKGRKKQIPRSRALSHAEPLARLGLKARARSG